MTTQSHTERVEASNRRVRRNLVLGRETLGYLPVYLHGTKVHAAISETPGHSGFVFPRAFCQVSTSLVYAADYGDDPTTWPEVTCKRCLASLEKKGLN